MTKLITFASDGDLQFNAATIRRPKERALRYSIQKWEAITIRIHDGLPAYDGGWRTCALCMNYFVLHDCVGCPVFEFTGKTGCDDTPYKNYSGTGDKKAAVRELKFLRDLYATHFPNSPVP